MAAALGNFDGVHRGHGQVILPVVEFCRRVNQAGAHDDPGYRKTYSTVVTFSPHPQAFFRVSCDRSSHQHRRRFGSWSGLG